MRYRDISIGAAFDYWNDSMIVEQSREELLWAYEIAALNVPSPMIACEIGSAGGGNLYLLSKMLPDNGLVISVEPELCFPMPVDTIRYMMEPVELVHVRATSADAVDDVTKLLDGRPIDILFLDAEHNYWNVAADWSYYSPMVRNPGIVIMHDMVNEQGGPLKLYTELIHAGYTGWVMATRPDKYGVGVILV